MSKITNEVLKESFDMMTLVFCVLGAIALMLSVYFKSRIEAKHISVGDSWGQEKPDPYKAKILENELKIKNYQEQISANEAISKINYKKIEGNYKVLDELVDITLKRQNLINQSIHNWTPEIDKQFEDLGRRHSELVKEYKNKN